MPTDPHTLKARLDAMVYKVAPWAPNPGEFNKASYEVALDLLSQLDAERLRNEALEARVKAWEDAIPHSWLDPLLTGPAAVLGEHPWGYPAIERLLNAIKARAALKEDKP